MSTKRYKEVWQVWELVKPQPETVVKDVVEHDVLERNNTFRFKMQTARIEKRMSIAELAAAVKCEVALLASFERGLEVIDSQMQSELRKILNI